MSIEKLVEALKHLPGQHDQSSHAGQHTTHGRSPVNKKFQDVAAEVKTPSDVGKLRKRAKKYIDDADDLAMKQGGFSNYTERKSFIEQHVPEGWPTNYGDLETLMSELKDKRQTYVPRSAEDARIARISQTIDSSGKRRARKW